MANFDSKVIDNEYFNQILEMDEDPDNRDFSKELTWDFLDQSGNMLGSMDHWLQEGDIENVVYQADRLLHPAKTFGVVKLASRCKEIKKLGMKKEELERMTDCERQGFRREYSMDVGEEEGFRQKATNMGDEERLGKIREHIVIAKENFQEAEVLMRRFYGEG